MARYIIKLKRFERGKQGQTRYSYSTKIKSCVFAAGYLAAIRDMGRTDLYLSVWDGNEKIMDNNGLEEIIAREY